MIKECDHCLRMGQGEALRIHIPLPVALQPELVADSSAGSDALESYIIIEVEVEDEAEEAIMGSDGTLERSNGAKINGNFSFGQGHVVASHRKRSLLDSPMRRKMPSESQTSRNHMEEA